MPVRRTYANLISNVGCRACLFYQPLECNQINNVALALIVELRCIPLPKNRTLHGKVKKPSGKWCSMHAVLGFWEEILNF